MFKPFPHVFVRYATLHHGSFKDLQIHGLTRFLLVQQTLTQRLSDLRDTLCETLFTEIAAPQSDEQRRRLIRLKRDLHNCKLISHEQVSWLEGISSGLSYNFGQYVRHQQRLQQCTDAWELYYQRTVQLHRNSLQRLAGTELLKKGLLLSSQSLYEQLPSFLTKDPSAFRHKESKIEYGLLLYLTRMAFKTSPFSTFTCTGIAELTQSTHEFELPLVTDIRSNIRLNNSLHNYFRALMLHHPVLSDLLLISLNNTADVQNDAVQFLVNAYNIESFQTMPVTAMIEWLQDFFKVAKQVPLGSLTSQLSEISGYQAPQIKSYLLKLIHAGFLEAGTVTSGIHPEWDEQLCRFFASQPVQNAAIELLHSTLLALRQKRYQYATASADERYQVLEDAAVLLNSTIHTLLEQAQIKLVNPQTAKEQQLAYMLQLRAGQFSLPPLIAQPFLPGAILFEDAALDQATQLPHFAVEGITHKVHVLGDIIALADPMQPERERMRDFFLKHYGKDATVSVTRFYHAYYFFEKKQTQQQSRMTPRADFPESIRTQFNDRLHISYERDEKQCIRTVHLAIKHMENPRKGSMAMFVQFFKEEGAVKGVINHYLPGMGKVAGRFIDLFDEHIGEKFCEWNQLLHRDAMLIELSDGSDFNANMHPPLLTWELRIPGGQNNYPIDRQVFLKDLLVQFDEDKNCLYLWHCALKKQVFTFDLSLESFYRRSKFYQLLAHFNYEYRILMRQFNSWLDKMVEQEHNNCNNEVIFRPRIVFDQDVVMRRAGWVIPVSQIPIQQKNETDSSWFLRLNTWRIHAGIPEHVFLYLQSPYIPAGEIKTKSMRDDHKPQYIHFVNPLLSGLFKKVVLRAGSIYLEEMLPHVNYLESCKDKPPVTECLVHWYQF